MSNAFEKMKVAMELRGFAEKTQKKYLYSLKRFSDFFGKPPEELGYDEVREFLYHEIKVRKLSSYYVNGCYAAIKFFNESAMCRDWNMKHIPRLKQRRFLPTILTPDEVYKVIDSTNNLKHKTILSTIYSSGLRVSEAAHLKISDIDSTNMRILVHQGKGFKDRNTILSQKNLLLLRDYWKQYRPKYWLFPGVPEDKAISVRTIQRVFQDAVKKSGITKDVSVHTLRHCFATHLLNKGANIVQIKDLLGHGSIDTTCKYLHLTDSQILGVKSPLDVFGGDDNA